MIDRFKRGSVWMYERYTSEDGITYGKHPCVIVSSDEWNAISASLVVVPCTTSALKGTIKDIKLELSSSEGYFFPTQITTVPKNNVFGFLGFLRSDEMSKLEEAVGSLLGCVQSELFSTVRDTVETTASSVYVASPTRVKQVHGSSGRGPRPNYSRGKRLSDRRIENVPRREPEYSNTYMRRAERDVPARHSRSEQDTEELYYDLHAAFTNNADLDTVCDKWKITQNTAKSYYYKLKKQFANA